MALHFDYPWEKQRDTGGYKEHCRFYPNEIVQSANIKYDIRLEIRVIRNQSDEKFSLHYNKYRKI